MPVAPTTPTVPGLTTVSVVSLQDKRPAKNFNVNNNDSLGPPVSSSYSAICVLGSEGQQFKLNQLPNCQNPIERRFKNWILPPCAEHVGLGWIREWPRHSLTVRADPNELSFR